jgi:hypothetical protein
MTGSRRKASVSTRQTSWRDRSRCAAMAEPGRRRLIQPREPGRRQKRDTQATARFRNSAYIPEDRPASLVACC